MWRNNHDFEPSRKKGIVSVTNTHEHFNCKSVTVAVTWPFTSTTMDPRKQELDHGSENDHVPQTGAQDMPDVKYQNTNISSNKSNHNGDWTSVTWPEEFITPAKQSHNPAACLADDGDQAPNLSAWGLVFVTAGRGGQIKTFQNFGFPVRV